MSQVISGQERFSGEKFGRNHAHRPAHRPGVIENIDFFNDNNKKEWSSIVSIHQISTARVY